MRFREDNLVARSINYKDLRKVFNYEEDKLKEAILAISNDALKVRLGIEAREYWANILHTDPLLIYYGDIDDTDAFLYPNDELPYEYVVGNIDLNEALDMSKLKGVLGSLHSRKSKNFPNLEFVNETITLDPYHNYQPVNLPKLKKCKQLYLEGCRIVNLVIEETAVLCLKDAKINKLNAKKVTSLNISGSTIKDLSSLQSVWSLLAYDVDYKNLILNPDLKITFSFGCSDEHFQAEVLNKHSHEL